ncbi:hypothetical protein HN51_010509 [Arachis hypogaea]|uniref:uncharacterized protein n=1 Tax=Arachis hypogaea TaxID=3818 RepID=UPI000DEC8628|nr:uncharacterized protein LOC112789163 [Arachis hypogaea]QHO55603.1 uncharacterized protein DS421_3g66580 [Arachis hypogaea]
MVQRRVLSKLGIQADQVISEKSLSSPQHQDDKSRKSDINKKSKNSRSIKLLDFEAPTPRKSLYQPGNQRPLCAPTAASSSLQKHNKPLVRIDGSPNYMKPTSSSVARKESFLVSLQNTPTEKNLPQKCSRASSISCKRQEKPLTRSSNLNLARSLTKTTTFKSTAAILHADMNPPVRATCSSTLKDSRFPAYLMLNHGANNEYEGTSVTKVCPYKYCSLNGHYHTHLSSLKSFVPAKRRILKTQKSMTLESLSPQRLKMQCQTDSSDIEQNVLDGKHAHNEADKRNPITTPLAQKSAMDFFTEKYVKIKEGAGDRENIYSAEDLEDEDDMKSVTEEDGIKCVIQTINHDLPKCEINLEDDFKDWFTAAAIEADNKGSSPQETNAVDADENHSTIWFGEEIYMGSYTSEVSYDGEHMHNIEVDGCHSQDTDNVELDGSSSQDTDIQWKEEEQFFSFGHGENIDSSIFTKQESDSNFESLSERSRDVSVMWLDEILGNHHTDILVEGTLREASDEKNTYFEAKSHGSNSVLEGTCESMELETQENDYLSNGIIYDQLPPTDDEAFQHLTDVEEIMNENSMNKNLKAEERFEDSNIRLENNVEGISEDNQIHPFEVPEEINIVVQDHELLEEDQGNTSKFQCTSCIGGEDLNTSKETKHKRIEKDDEQLRKIKPRKPNFLTLVPEPEPEKVNLKHQIMDDRKDAKEWMLDFALRQAVTQLAPVRKRKVALLVEAYEKVMSLPKCESHNSPFAHARPIQACS